MMDNQGVLYILLTTLISLIGIGLLCMLFCRLREISAIHKKSKYQHKREGMTDLLQCSALIRDGVILNKNGSMTASFFIQGIDFSQAIDSDKNNVSAKINHALGNLAKGWMIHVDSIRIEAPKYIERERSHFPDLVSFAIDEERRAFFENGENVFEGAQVLSVTYFPPLLVQQKFVELLYDDNQTKKSAVDYTNAVINEFERQLSFIESNLSDVFNMSRMKGISTIEENGDETIFDEQSAYMQYCITGINQPIRLSQNMMFLDSVIGGQDLWTGTIPKIGDKYIMAVSIDGFPLEGYPGILNFMTTMPCECRFSTRFQFMDRMDADTYASKISKKWKQKQTGIMAAITRNPNPPVDADAVYMTQDADMGVAEIRSGLVSYGFYTAAMLLMDSDREKIEKAAAEIHKELQNLGFNARIETINTLEAYLGSIPGHGQENVRRYFIHTLNLADLLPTNTIWTGDKECPCPFFPVGSPVLMHTVASGRTPYRFNLHISDVGHCAIVGPTGAGKSTLLAEIACQFRRYPSSKVYIFDKGRSLYALTKAVGGSHFDIGQDTQDGKLSLAPFSYLDDANDRSWLLDWVDKILLLNKFETEPEDRNEIGAAINSLFYTSGVDKPDITKFILDIQNRKIRDALEQYNVTGNMGSLLAGTDDSLRLSDFTTFELDSLMSLGDKWCLPVLLYIFRRIEKSLLGQPTLIMIDEAWSAFKNEVFRDQLFEWLKVLRKKNCSVVLATQDLSDIADSGMLANIRESTSTKIFLPNAGAANEDTIELYKQFGLNLRQIQVIVGGQKKQDYYHFCGSKGSRLFSLALEHLPLSLAFVGVSDPETIEKIMICEKEHGSQWAEAWLSKRNLSLEPYKDLFSKYMN